jgi:hypothetical protein
MTFMLSQFPEARFTKDEKGLTPHMLYLSFIPSGDRDMELLTSLMPSNFEFIGEPQNSPFYPRRMNNRAVYRLDHHDPTLTEVSFHHMGAKSGFFDVMDAIYSNPHINHIHLKYLFPDSFLWGEDMARNALMVLLREKSSVKSITIDIDTDDLTPFVNVFQQCLHLENLTIKFPRRTLVGTTIEQVVQWVRHLPSLRSVVFHKSKITHEAGTAIAESLITKRSMVALTMVNCDVDPGAALAILHMLSHDDDCTLRDVSLFTVKRKSWMVEKDREIRLTIRHNATVQSIKAFVEKVTGRDSRNEPATNEFADIEEANRKDKEDLDPIHPPNHLYTLLQAKPHYVKRYLGDEMVGCMSIKRQKL